MLCLGNHNEGKAEKQHIEVALEKSLTKAVIEENMEI